MRRRSPRSAGRTASRRGRRAASIRSCHASTGSWNFSKNKPAAKSLLDSLTSRENAEKQVAASQGYDIPPYTKFNDFKTWDDEGPPKGSMSHYPIKGGDQRHRRHLLARAASDCSPDLGAVDPKPDARPLRQGRDDGQDHGLGRARGRRLQADLRSGLLTRALAPDLPRAAPFVRRGSRPTLRP